MPKYRPVYTKIWKDKDFLNAGKDSKLLFFYLITNESNNNSGIYEIPIKTISMETGIPSSTVGQLLTNGSIKNIDYDLENEVVFVTNSRKYSPGGNPAQVEKGIISEFKQNSKTFLWESFLELNPQFKEIFSTVGQRLVNRSLPLPLPLPLPLDSKVLLNNKPLKMEKEKEVLEYLNLRARKNFKPTPTNLGFISGRLDEKYNVDELKRVVDLKVAEWLDDKDWDKFLRPQTLFNATKFSGYVNQKSGLVEKTQTKGSRKLAQMQRLVKDNPETKRLEVEL